MIVDVANPAVDKKIGKLGCCIALDGHEVPLQLDLTYCVEPSESQVYCTHCLCMNARTVYLFTDATKVLWDCFARRFVRFQMRILYITFFFRSIHH